ncbi:von Willebrand factor type A domain-containing protein, partial [Hygrophoropsis aurantiaca]
KDVILVITADGLDKPRAVMEPHPVHQTDAIGLTLVPQFKPIESPLGMEYIFLVDRSGSMEGANVDMARTAHTLLLQGLPSKNTTFNIFSFGSRVSSLWPASRTYDQNSVDAAMSHIKTMEADYGGTEIALALKAVYKSLATPLVRPVSVFLLTDGGAWDVERCAEITKRAISERASDATFMRLFTVGLGQGVSTATCDGIARAGGGMTIYVSSPEEDYLGKCARLVRAARAAPVTDLQVTWPGQRTLRAEHEGSPVVQNDLENSTDAELGPPPAYLRQAPSTIPSFFPSTRLHIYAILSRSTAAHDSEIKITGFVPAANTPLEVVIPPHDLLRTPGAAFLHTSAAKALITELEDDNAVNVSRSQRRAEIIGLGTTYGLTSRFTSFIAVDNGEQVLD